MKIPKIIFIVPYRARENDKIHFEVYMKYLMEDYNEDDYEIYYAHQVDDRSFNRGAIKNIGFLAMREKYPQHYREITFVFNDIDTLPFRKGMLDYKTEFGIVKHFYGFDNALGGIFSITGANFEQVKGFPNYWAWGWEDNVIHERCLNTGLTIDRSQFYKIYDKDFIQTNITHSKILNNKRPDTKRADNNNFLTLLKVEYSIFGNMIHVTGFQTLERYETVKFYVQDLSKDKKISNDRNREDALVQHKKRWSMTL